MIDLRPVVYVIGLVVAILGATMLVPMVVDLYYGSPDWLVFLSTATITDGGRRLDVARHRQHRRARGSPSSRPSC